jgi:hypothetical protein
VGAEADEREHQAPLDHADAARGDGELGEKLGGPEGEKDPFPRHVPGDRHERQCEDGCVAEPVEGRERARHGPLPGGGANGGHRGDLAFGALEQTAHPLRREAPSVARDPHEPARQKVGVAEQDRGSERAGEHDQCEQLEGEGGSLASGDQDAGEDDAGQGGDRPRAAGQLGPGGEHAVGAAPLVLLEGVPLGEGDPSGQRERQGIAGEGHPDHVPEADVDAADAKEPPLERRQGDDRPEPGDDGQQQPLRADALELIADGREARAPVEEQVAAEQQSRDLETDAQDAPAVTAQPARRLGDLSIEVDLEGHAFVHLQRANAGTGAGYSRDRGAKSVPQGSGGINGAREKGPPPAAPFHRLRTNPAYQA